MWYLIIPYTIFIADYFIKKHIEEKHRFGEESEILGGTILVRKSHNKGAMLNFMDNRPKLVAAVSLFCSVGILAGYVVVQTRKGMHLLKVGLAFILGGGVGNLYDRLVRHYVVDYFSFRSGWKKLRDVVFNISDMFIFAGCLLTVLANCASETPKILKNAKNLKKLQYKS